MKRMKNVGLLLLAAVLLGSVSVAALPPAAQAGQALPAGSAGNQQVPTGPVVVRLYVTGHDDLDRVAGRLDILEVHYDLGYALVAVQPEEYRWLLSLGYRVEIDTKWTAKLLHPLSIPGFPCYRTVEETYASLQQLVDDYPTLVTLTDIGNSWDKAMAGGNPGYDILRLKITNQAIPGPKPNFYLMAEIHAREYATAELAMRFAEYLLQNYGTDPVITFFVDYYTIQVVPMVNPDGRKIAEGGDWWRKNVDNDDGCTDPNNWGTDLNRNYAFKFNCCGGSDDYPCGETYHGPGAASEPETQAIQNDVLITFPDQRGPGDTDPAPDDATGLFLTLHSAASLVLWPWGWTGTDAPNGAQLQTIGVKLATYNGYTPQQSNDLYTTDGTTDDWTYGALGVASFTFEMAGEFFQPCSSFETTDWPDNRDALLYAMKIAQTPYMTSYGPDSLNTAAVPGLITPGQPVQLTATVNDVENGGQVVQAAEYYLIPLHDDAEPGDPGTGTAMLPADGNWNSSVEQVTASLDTSSLTSGTYLLAVRGRDAQNHWGPFGAAFLYVAEPGVSPTIEGYVRESGSNMPLDATVTAGNFSAQTDPSTGFYSMMVISGTYDITAVAADHAPATASDVVAHNYDTVQQDFSLSPICEVFGDDMEAGPGGWTHGGTPNNWALVVTSSHSPTHSWTDSPSGNYPNNANTWLQSQVIDLSDYTGSTLSFWHRYATEGGYDYAIVEYSINGGSTWNAVQSYDGVQNTWTQQQLAIPALDGQSNVRLRFHLTSDSYQTADGWYIDDVSVTGGGPSCQPAFPPDADFDSNSPVVLGLPMVFNNLTGGTLPMTFSWDFGDGVGSSTLDEPTYTYLSTGTFTVTLVATNAVGTDTVQHPVVVLPPPCVDVTGVSIDGAIEGLPGVYTFTAGFQPPDAGQPVAWLWDNGDTTATSARDLADLGTYTLTVTATNCVDAQATASHSILIAAPDIEVTPPPLHAVLHRDETATQVITVCNEGNATLDWSLAELAAVDWLDESPTAGSLPPAECADVTVTFDSAGLAPGDLIADLLFTSNDPDEAAINFPVMLTVIPAQPRYSVYLPIVVRGYPLTGR